MALAFKRASTAADEAMKGYYSHFRDYYGFTSEVPITFDWPSAKAIEGTTKFNANDEELAKGITICNYIASSPNYVPPIFYKLGQLAKDHEELVFGAMRKHWNSVVVHFDDKGTTPGKCDWSLNSVKDGVLDLTMKWNFSQYMGDGNYDAAGELAFTWLDDAENIKMQVMKANTTKPGAWTNFNTHTVDYLKEKLGDAAPPVVVNWDEIAATPGRFLDASNYPPERASWILTKLIGEGQLLYAVHWALDHVLKDDDGKEAFSETFKEIKINVSAGAAHSLSVAKSGSSLVFTIVVEMKDHYNAERNHDYSAVGKAIEAML